MEFTYNQYCEDVMAGHILTCGKVKLAVKRHLNDIKRQSSDSFPYYFDKEQAESTIEFFTLMVHTKGAFAGQRLKLEPWQQFIVACIYGWRKDADGTRRFRRVYIQVGRKNGKTFFSSGVGLNDLVVEPGAEIYSAATKHDQAERCFQDAKNSVIKSPVLKKKITANAHTLTYKDGKMAAVSADYSTLDGLNPSTAIIDEYHAHKTDDVLQVLHSGMGEREQPLLFIITTAGNNTNSPCYGEYEKINNILKKVKGFDNEEYFGIIFELDKKDDWKDPKNWIKANPNLDISVKRSFMEDSFKNALQKTSDEAEFRTKNLDEWINVADVWITDRVWVKCQRPFDEDLLIGQPCWGGIDLSKRLDWTVITWYFRVPGSETDVYAKHYFYIPEAQIEKKMKTDSWLVRRWIKMGLVIATPGETVDYEFMRIQILSDARKYDIREIAYDRNMADVLIEKVSPNFNVINFNQSVVGMSEPSKDWEKLVVDHHLIDNNPVMRWMVSNTTIRSDAHGNIHVVKPTEGKSSKRIDGVVTSIMANNRLQASLEQDKKEAGLDPSEMVF